MVVVEASPSPRRLYDVDVFHGRRPGIVTDRPSPPVLAWRRHPDRRESPVERRRRERITRDGGQLLPIKLAIPGGMLAVAPWKLVAARIP